MTLSPSNWRTPIIVLIAGSLLLTISLGIRHSFGLFLQPMSLDLGWGREVFATAIAVQNLLWGLSQPFAGRIADRYGAGRVVLVGAALYAAGLYLMSSAGNEAQLLISAGVLIGIGQSGTTFPVVFAVVSRAVSPEKRSMAMGTAMSAGSLGQFLLLPGSNTLITSYSWSMALVVLAVLSIIMLPLAAAMMEPNRVRQIAPMPLKAVLAEAATHRGFWLLSFGFFVCGFQVVFIAVHLPAFLVDEGLSASTGAIVLGLIGLFNIFGSLLAGYFGGRVSKPWLLSGLYTGRLVVISIFLLLPVTQGTAYAFGIAMGFLWLSTVPLTNGIVATIFGVENMSMLGGIVFLFHQLGAFLGGWLGGYLYDLVGNYNSVWGIAMGLSVMAALLNLPIREKPVARLAAQEA